MQRMIRAMACAVVVLATCVTSAQASTLRATSAGLRFDAAPGEVNRVTASTDGRVLLLADTGAAITGALPSGCTVEAATSGSAVRCTAPGAVVLRMDLGDGDDFVDAIGLRRRVSLVVVEGDGRDVVQGGAGDDRISGGAGGDTLYGGPGADVVDGGADGDYVRGHGGDDEIRGGAGIDFVIGDGGDDWIDGGSELDYIDGGSGDDVIFGGAGSDDIGAGAGDDVVDGGEGDDELRGGKGSDRLRGGAGDDLLRARDGEHDVLDCGAGSDVARVDANEVDTARRSCEKVKEADAAVPADPADQDVLPGGATD